MVPLYERACQIILDIFSCLNIVNADKFVCKTEYDTAGEEIMFTISGEVIPVAELITQIEKQGAIDESKSPWSSPIVLLKKKNGKTRFCVNYRHLDEITKKDSSPLIRIEDTLNALVGSSWFSTVDLQNGYWHIAMDEKVRRKLLFQSGMYFGNSSQSHAFWFKQCYCYL